MDAPVKPAQKLFEPFAATMATVPFATVESGEPKALLEGLAPKSRAMGAKINLDNWSEPLTGPAD